MKVDLEIGGQSFVFGVSHEEFNRFLNEQAPNDKVGPAFNFVSRSVSQADKERLIDLMTDNGTPRGLLVMSIAAELTKALGGDIEVVVKKPSA